MNPFIPTTKPRYVIIDYRADEHIIKFFDERNIGVIKTVKCTDLQEPVDGHPDMVLHPVDEKTFVAAPNVYDYYASQLIPKGIKVIEGGKTLCRNYPGDIAYNVARIGRYAVHNVRYTDSVLKCCLEAAQIGFIHVNQGYAKCSVAALGENKAITSDAAVRRVLNCAGIECLYMKPGMVRLKGFDYGFIGGALQVTEPGILTACGSIKDMEEAKRLRAFAASSGYVYMEASDEIITDLGTVIPVI